MPRAPRVEPPRSFRRHLAVPLVGALIALLTATWPGARAFATGAEEIPSAPLLSIGQSVSVATDRLHLREDPDTGAESILVLTTGQTGAVVDGPVDGAGYVWYQIDIDGAIGWSAGNFLEASGAATTAVTEDASGLVAIGGDAGGLSIGVMAVINDDGVNLRAAAGLDAEVIDQLSAGTTVSLLDGPVESDGYAWHQVDVGGVTGWVASTFLSAETSASEITVGAAVVVNDDRVNLRDAAGLDAGIIAKLSTGQAGTVVDGPVDADDYIWYFIEIDGGSGWVAGNFLSAA